MAIELEQKLEGEPMGEYFPPKITVMKHQWEGPGSQPDVIYIHLDGYEFEIGLAVDGRELIKAVEAVLAE